MALTSRQISWLKTQPLNLIVRKLQTDARINIEDLRAYAATDHAFALRLTEIERLMALTPNPAEEEQYNNLKSEIAQGITQYVTEQIEEYIDMWSATPSAAQHVAELKSALQIGRENDIYSYLVQQSAAAMESGADIPKKELLDALDNYLATYTDETAVPEEHIVQIQRYHTALSTRRRDGIDAAWQNIFTDNNPDTGTVASLDSMAAFIDFYGDESSYKQRADNAAWEYVASRGNNLADARKYADIFGTDALHYADYADVEFKAITTPDGAAADIDALKNFHRRFVTYGRYSTLIDDAWWKWALKQPDVIQSTADYNAFFRNLGIHSPEVAGLKALLAEWNQIHTDDVFDILAFRDSHPGTPLLPMVNAAIERAKDGEVRTMLRNPAGYSDRKFRKLIDSNVFTFEEMQAILNDTDGHIIRRILDRQQIIDNIGINIPTSTPTGIAMGGDGADVVLFGVVSSGKTCLLTGLLCNEKLRFESDDWSGRYAQALDAYGRAGIAPNPTQHGFVAAIKCSVKRTRKKNKKQAWVPFNMVDMAGEQFVRMVQQPENETVQPSFAHMGTGAPEILANGRDKVFLLLIDPTLNAAGMDLQRRVMKSLIDIMANEKNKDIIRSVRALHFIVTKADTLDSADGSRIDAAHSLVCDKVIRQADRDNLIELCIQNGINVTGDKTTNGHPRVFCFSLGSFYPGNTFEIDRSDSDILLNVVTDYINALRKKRNLLAQLYTYPFV